MPRTFYPESKPNKESFLDVDDEHKLYYAEYGNPNGIPVVVCHGGPGAGSDPYFAQYFNPQQYRIVLFDQRGAGKSTPKGSLNNNTTKHHISDMEKLRKHLGIKQWVVQGGSWGATLALLYAEAHPKCVLGLILRGVFLGREKDTHGFTTEGCPAALLHSEQWEIFKEKAKALLDRVNFKMPMNNLIDVFYTLLTQPNKQIQSEAAALFSWWEECNATLKYDQTEVDWAGSEDGVNMGITEITYMKNHWYIEENQILKNVEAIKNIPIYIVNGQYDLVCPKNQAAELAKHLKNVVAHYPISGHAGSQPETVHFLVESTDALAKRLNQEMKVVSLPNALSILGASTIQQANQVNQSDYVPKHQ